MRLLWGGLLFLLCWKPGKSQIITSISGPKNLVKRILFSDEPERVTLRPFSVRLAPTPLEWLPQTLNELYDVIHDVIVAYIGDRTPTGLSMRYFVMTEIGVQDANGNISILRIGEGAAAFDVTAPDRASVVTPTQEEIETWMREALDTNLVPAVNAMMAENYDSTDFVDVQQARFISLSESAVGGLQDGSIKEEASRSSSSRSTANAALASSVAVAGVAILLLGALLVRAYRQRTREAVAPFALETAASDSLDTAEVSARNRSSLRPSRQIPLANEGIRSDSARPRTSSQADSFDMRSLGESESSWTMATEVGDSLAVQSVVTHQSIAAASTESFEHDRQVYIQKDMLTTTWSGQNASGVGNPNAESVLQPSHFRASSERKSHRQWTDVDESPSPFIVASHDDAEVGEEVFLMPEDTSRRASSNELL